METENKDSWGQGVEIGAPRLHEMAFLNERGKLPSSPLNIEYSIAINRSGPLSIGVQFGAEISDVPGFTLRAVYRMNFALKPDSPEAAESEKALKLIASRMAPVTMYPFVREVILSAAQRALLPPTVLPIQNVGALWSPDEIKLPPVEESQSAEDVETH